MLLCLVATGAAWHQVRWSVFHNNDLGAFAAESAQPVCVEAVALSGPRRLRAPPFDPLRPIARPDRSRMELQVTGVRDGATWIPAVGRTTLTVDGHVLGIQAGDRLQVFGHLAAPRPPLNPGEFDFAAHRRGDRQLCLLATDHPQCLTRVAEGSAWRASRLLDRVRQAGDAALWRDLSRAQSGLGLALLLGQREELDADTTRHFFQTGTVHLLSISGLHVGILAGALFFTLRLGLVKRTVAIVAVATIVTVYALVIDAEPPAVRATVLVWLVCLAMYRGRRASFFNLLAAAALVVVAMNPADLFRIGPQLSFLCMGTLVWIGPRVARRRPLDPLARLVAQTRPWPQRAIRSSGGWLWRSLAVSAAVWLVTLPLVLARFHIVAPAVLFLTPVLAVPVAVGMMTGFALIVFGWLIWPLSMVIGRMCDASLLFVTAAVSSADRWPGSHFWLPGPPWWWLAVFYGLLGLWVADARWRPPLRWCAAIVAAWTTVGFGAAGWTRSHQQHLECTVLAVGHGCSAVLELPDGRTLVYDAGQFGSPDAAARAISGCLWARGRRHVDAVVLSHADVDHFNALPELLNRFTVGAVYVSPVMFDAPSPATEALRQAILAAGVPLKEIWAGDRLRGGDCAIEVLHPPRRGTLGSDNSNSIVLSVEYEGRRLLLPGDLESPGLDELLAESPLHCDVLLAPHHGSARSDPPGFAAWSTPAWVIISGDRRSTRPEVASAYETRGATVLNTSRVGAVTAVVQRDRLQVTSWRAASASRDGWPATEVWAVPPQEEPAQP